MEVDQIYHENNLRVSQPGGDTKLEKTGLYGFDASNGAVRVFDGKAVVTADDRKITVNKNQELAFDSPKLKARGFLRMKSQRLTTCIAGAACAPNTSRKPTLT